MFNGMSKQMYNNGFPNKAQGQSPAQIIFHVIFNPANINNGFPLNGDRVSSVKCETGQVLNQPTLASQPVFNTTDAQFNNKPSIHLNGISGTAAHWMTLSQAVLLGGNYCAAFVVRKTNVPNQLGVIMQTDNTGFGNGGINFSIGGTFFAQNTGIGIYNHANDTIMSTNVEDSLPHIAVFSKNNIVVDGILKNLLILSNQDINWPMTRIGYNDSFGSLGGNIAEIIIYNTNFNPNQMIALSDYLNSKYALY